jgi:predicted ATPase/transcriptional regulator with XRE-family HTH domain
MNNLEGPSTFGEWLKARRKALDLTQEELARHTGCSIFALRKIESGERKPSKQLASLLADALQIREEDRLTFIRVARGDLNLQRIPSAGLGVKPALLFPQPALPHLPVPPTPLLGRDRELAAMERLFNEPQCRLLTLTGMGGIGKTRLAIEFSWRQRCMFPDGVYYVPLASINSAELIVPAVAEALAFSFSGPIDLKEQLINYMLSHFKRPALLVLDNLEHLIAPSLEAVGLISEVVQRLPNLKILTTSRERLNLQGEWMYELHGLPVPPTEFVSELQDYSAVVLFVQSARRIKHDLEITPDVRPALVRICHLLEGIPLAIELAAAWAGILSIPEIVCEIELNIDFLETSVRDVPERHRSLRASFDHSWKLLSDQERSVLCRLAIFHGGFDRLAAERVAGATLPLLASLVAKSLVRRAENERYDLHEVIRQFALSYLDDDSSQCIKARNAHSEYYLRFAAEREKALRSAPQQAVARELIHEMDNIRAAWAWGIQQETFSLVGRTVRSLGWFFEVAGLIHEGIEQFELLVQALKKQPNEWQEILGQTLTQQGMLYFRKGLFDRAQTAMVESLSLLRPLGKQNLMIDVLVYLGIIMHLNGNMERSQSLVEEGLAYAQAASDDWFVAYAVYNLGYIASLRGMYAKGHEQMLEGMSIWRRLGDPHSIALGLNYLSPTLVKMGCYEEAEDFLQESLRLCKESGNRWGMGTAYRYLGLVKLALENFNEANSYFHKSLETFGDFIVGWDIARTYTYLGDTMRLAGDLEEARKIYLAALRLSQEAESVPLMLDSLVGLAQLDVQTGCQEQAFELSQFVLTHGSSTQETKDCANQIVLEVGRHLDCEQVRVIEERLSTQSLEKIVNTLISR